MVAALRRAGFVEERQTGSHLILRHPERRAKVSVPLHNRDLGRGIMLALIRAAGLTPEEFANLL